MNAECYSWQYLFMWPDYQFLARKPSFSSWPFGSNILSLLWLRLLSFKTGCVKVNLPSQLLFKLFPAWQPGDRKVADIFQSAAHTESEWPQVSSIVRKQRAGFLFLTVSFPFCLSLLSVALINHSCLPSVIVTYNGTSADVRAVRDMNPGDEVRKGDSCH